MKGCLTTLFFIALIYFVVGDSFVYWAFGVVALAALLIFFHYKNKPKEDISIDVQSANELQTLVDEGVGYESEFVNAYLDTSAYDEGYFKIIKNQPSWEKVFGRPMNMPKYTDKFRTGNKYKLRELLLLIWWGKPKNGRKISAGIPKYFFFSYNLNAEKLTKQFYSDGLLANDGEKVFLTDKGKELYDEFEELWEIHSLKNYPSNLDIDFEDWDKESFDEFYYNANMEYYAQEAKIQSKLIDHYSKRNMPELVDQHTQYRNNAIIMAQDFSEKLKAL